MNPAIANTINLQRQRRARSPLELLLDLHAMHARLGGLIIELESALDLEDPDVEPEPCSPDRDH